jgi:uracil-DNA glycosylase
MNTISNPFQFTTGPASADIVIVGEAWGEEEDNRKLPFVGASGQELDRMLGEAGLNREDILCTNVINERPPNGKMEKYFAKKKAGVPEKWDLYPAPNILAGINNLQQVITAHPRKLVIAAGNFAHWALTGLGSIGDADKDDGGGRVPTGITDWRGSMVRTRPEFGSLPCLPIVHPVMVFKQYSWRSVLVHDLTQRVPYALDGRWDFPSRTKVATPNFREVVEFFTRELKELDSGKILWRVCDIETKRRNIVCTGFATSKEWAIAIPHCGINVDRHLTSWWPFAEEVTIMGLMRRYLLHPNIRLIGQNFLYDMQYLSRWLRAPRIKCAYDTMLGQHTMFPGTPKSLDYLASLYCEWYAFWKHESQEWEEEGDIDRLLYYNCLDTMYTYEVWEEQGPALDSIGMRPHFDFLMHSNEFCFDTMKEGFAIDAKVRSDLLFQVMGDVTPRQKWLAKIIPQSYMKGWVKETKNTKKWWESTHQQRILFYEILGLKEQRDRKTKRPTINDEALNNLKVLYPWLSRLFEVMAELRSLGVFMNTFLKAPLDPDGRLRCSLNPGGTETFRYSSSTNAFWRGTNMQNIPKGDED